MPASVQYLVSLMNSSMFVPTTIYFEIRRGIVELVSIYVVNYLAASKPSTEFFLCNIAMHKNIAICKTLITSLINIGLWLITTLCRGENVTGGLLHFPT